MGEQRREAQCDVCGKVGTVATSGAVFDPVSGEPWTECHKCFRRRQRVDQRARECPAIVDRYAVPPSLRKLRKQLSTAFFSKFLAGMDDMGLPEEEIQKHVDMVRPYLEPIKDRLPPMAPRQQSTFGEREHRLTAPFTFTEPDAAQPRQK